MSSFAQILISSYFATNNSIHRSFERMCFERIFFSFKPILKCLERWKMPFFRQNLFFNSNRKANMLFRNFKEKIALFLCNWGNFIPLNFFKPNFSLLLFGLRRNVNCSVAKIPHLFQQNWKGKRAKKSGKILKFIRKLTLSHLKCRLFSTNINKIKE